MSVRGIKWIDPVSTSKRGPKSARPIVRFGMNGKPIQVFKSVTEAMKKLKIAYPQLLYKNLRGKSSSAYGAQWRYLKDVSKG